MTIKNDILLKVDWDVLNEYIANNLIVANKHRDYDLWILNYSPKVQAKQLWDLYTMSCRGLVIDKEGNILARPFKKFKNFEEYDKSEIPQNEDFDVFEKMDGSLIILFYYKAYKEWIVASRGSFISEQAEEARKMVKKTTLSHLRKTCTYLFEVIYPENRIVVDYGNRKELVLLTIINTKDGGEPTYDDLYATYSKYFTVVKKLNIDDFSELLQYRELDKDNEEGVVVRFFNGFRMKIKFEEYVRLHAILTNVSNLTVWEHLMNGYDFDELIDRVPDEFYAWLKKTVAVLQGHFNDVKREALEEFVRIYHINEIKDRKLFADEAKKSENRAILFKIYDKRSYDSIIWKRIRPEYSKPFAHGYDIYS
jgi:RNA ligase